MVVNTMMVTGHLSRLRLATVSPHQILLGCTDPAWHGWELRPRGTMASEDTHDGSQLSADSGLWWPGSHCHSAEKGPHTGMKARLCVLQKTLLRTAAGVCDPDSCPVVPRPAHITPPACTVLRRLELRWLPSLSPHLAAHLLSSLLLPLPACLCLAVMVAQSKGSAAQAFSPGPRPFPVHSPVCRQQGSPPPQKDTGPSQVLVLSPSTQGPALTPSVEPPLSEGPAWAGQSMFLGTQLPAPPVPLLHPLHFLFLRPSLTVPHPQEEWPWLSHERLKQGPGERAVRFCGLPGDGLATLSWSPSVLLRVTTHLA